MPILFPVLVIRSKFLKFLSVYKLAVKLSRI